MQLPLIHESYFDCAEDCLAGLIACVGRDYHYIFAESWHILPAIPIPDEELTLHNQETVAERYCGVDLDYRCFQQYDPLAEYVLACLAEGLPVLLGVDMYNLSWSGFYQKVHSAHCLIVHDHREGDIFIVDDMTRQARNVEFDLRKGASSLTVVYTCSAQEVIPIGAEELIRNNIRRLREEAEERKGYEQFLSLAEKWAGGGDTVFDYPPELVECEKFAVVLLAAGRGRIAFAELLSYVAGQSGDHRFDDFIYDLKAKGARWQTVRNRFMKLRMKGSWSRKSREFMNDFTELIDQDKKIYEQFLLLGGRQAEGSELSAAASAADFPGGSQAEPMVIELRPYYNANGFNSHNFNNYEGFDQNGYYYGLEAENRLIEAEGIKISLSVDSRLDHISCQGQSIMTNYVNPSAILVIGSSEYGDFAANLSLQYEYEHDEEKYEHSEEKYGYDEEKYEHGEGKYGHDEEKVELILSDWWERGRYGEKIVKTLDCLKFTADRTTYEKVGTVHLFSQKIRVEEGKNKILKSIRLPDLPNIRLFGLVLF